MKFLIAFVIIAVVSVDAFTIKDLKNGERLATECIIEVGINPLAVNRLRKGDFSKVDSKSQCFVKCFFEKNGFMEGEDLIEDAIVEKLSSADTKEKVQEVYDRCKDLKGATSCETAFKVYECYLSSRN